MFALVNYRIRLLCKFHLSRTGMAFLFRIGADSRYLRSLAVLIRCFGHELFFDVFSPSSLSARSFLKVMDLLTRSKSVEHHSQATCTYPFALGTMASRSGILLTLLRFGRLLPMDLLQACASSRRRLRTFVLHNECFLS